MDDKARKILIVDDDVKPSQVLADYLRLEGYESIHITDGSMAVDAVRKYAPSVIVLDLMLPGLDGIQICRAVRLFSFVPIIMLTARIEEVDRILGLEIGADDYLCKPISPREVVARVRAQIRRAEGNTIQSSTTFGFVIDEDARRIRWQQTVLPLTQVEYRLLKTLLSHPGRLFGRDVLLDAVDVIGRDVSDRAVDSHIKNIRRKLKQYTGDKEFIHSVYGVGYRFELY
jgi:two-component system, OmpR family, response regulator BaeR